MDLKILSPHEKSRIRFQFTQYGDSFQFFHWTMSDQTIPISIAINTKIQYLDLTCIDASLE